MTSDEINRKYRNKDIEQWQRTAFVLGYEVKLSKNPKLQLPICKQLAGIYPKWFLFIGWADGCGCYVVPIMPDKEEYNLYEDAILDGKEDNFKFKSMVMDVPKNFKDWVEENQDLEIMPDFVKANFINGDIKLGLKYPTNDF